MSRKNLKIETRKRQKELIDDLNKSLDFSLEIQQVQTRILEAKAAKKKRRKYAAKEMVSGGRPIRVLVADQKDQVYDIVKNEVGMINGTSFEVSKAAHVDQVYTAIAGNQFDVILIDCESFIADEHNTEKLIKAAKKKNKHVPIIVYGPEDSHDCDIMAMEAGAAFFLIKSQITAKRLEKSIRYSIYNKA